MCILILLWTSVPSDRLKLHLNSTSMLFSFGGSSASCIKRHNIKATGSVFLTMWGMALGSQSNSQVAISTFHQMLSHTSTYIYNHRSCAKDSKVKERVATSFVFTCAFGQGLRVGSSAAQNTKWTSTSAVKCLVSAGTQSTRRTHITGYSILMLHSFAWRLSRLIFYLVSIMIPLLDRAPVVFFFPGSDVTFPPSPQSSHVNLFELDPGNFI